MQEKLAGHPRIPKMESRLKLGEHLNPFDLQLFVDDDARTDQPRPCSANTHTMYEVGITDIMHGGGKPRRKIGLYRMYVEGRGGRAKQATCDWLMKTIRDLIFPEEVLRSNEPDVGTLRQTRKATGMTIPTVTLQQSIAVRSTVTAAASASSTGLGDVNAGKHVPRDVAVAPERSQMEAAMIIGTLAGVVNMETKVRGLSGSDALVSTMRLVHAKYEEETRQACSI